MTQDQAPADTGAAPEGAMTPIEPARAINWDDWKLGYEAGQGDARKIARDELLDGLKAEGQKDEWIGMLSDALRRIVVAVSENDDWEGSVAEGLDLINAKFQQVNAEVDHLKAEREGLKQMLSLQMVLKNDYLKLADKYAEEAQGGIAPLSQRMVRLPGEDMLAPGPLPHHNAVPSPDAEYAPQGGIAPRVLALIAEMEESAVFDAEDGNHQGMVTTDQWIEKLKAILGSS